MSALVPAIIDFVISRMKKGRGGYSGGGYGGGGGGYGGRGPKPEPDINAQNEKYMNVEFLKSINQMGRAMNAYDGGAKGGSLMPQIDNILKNMPQIPPIHPGSAARPQQNR